MQSLEARQAYRNSFHCAYRIFTEEGLLRFWTGTTPRLARLVVRRVSPVPTGLLFGMLTLTIARARALGTAEWRDRVHGL